MKNKANRYLIFGVLFLAIGITMLMTGAVSKTMAYGDFVFAIAFFALSAREKKADESDKKDEPESPDRRE